MFREATKQEIKYIKSGSKSAVHGSALMVISGIAIIGVPICCICNRLLYIVDSMIVFAPVIGLCAMALGIVGVVINIKEIKKYNESICGVCYCTCIESRVEKVIPEIEHCFVNVFAKVNVLDSEKEYRVDTTRLPERFNSTKAESLSGRELMAVKMKNKGNHSIVLFDTENMHKKNSKSR